MTLDSNHASTLREVQIKLAHPAYRQNSFSLRWHIPSKTLSRLRKLYCAAVYAARWLRDMQAINPLLDAYREEVISLEELKTQKEKIASRRKVLEGKKKAVLSHSESLGQPQIAMNELGQPIFSVLRQKRILQHEKKRQSLDEFSNPLREQSHCER